jgi:hypothetical protein
MAVQYIPSRYGALEQVGLQAFQSGMDRGVREQQNSRQAALMGTDAIQKLSQTYNVTPEQQQKVIDAFGKGDANVISQVFGEIQRPENYRPEIIKSKQREDEKYNLGISGEKLGQIKTQAEIDILDRKARGILDPKEAKDAQKAFQDQVDSFRKEVSGGQSGRAMDNVTAAYSKIVNSAKLGTPAGDVGMIYGFMKIVDPGSTVREGEFATAQNAAGIPERVRQQYNIAISGNKLTPKMREEFLAAARVQAEGQLESFKQSLAPIRKAIQERGLPEGQIIPNYGLGQANIPQAQGGQKTQLRDSKLGLTEEEIDGLLGIK